MISEKRIADLVSISNKFLYKNLLPLKYQFFFILSNIYENSLNNIILSGDETLIINILYKYKYLSLGKKEQDYLYDSVISGKYPNLIGVVFQLYKNTFKGIRNIFPILNLIQNRWKLLNKEEKREYISVYQNTNQYLKTFFLMRKTFSNLEIKTWIKKISLLNGKDTSYHKSIEEKLASVDEKMKLHSKFTLLKEAKFLVNLTPFELILLFNSSVSMELREEIGEFYEKYPHSYSANRSLAVIFFQDGDYQKFLLQISKAGNFLFHVEVLYLKAIAYREIGMDEESKKIFTALKTKYPNSEILLKEAGLN